MPFFQNVFDQEYQGYLVLADRKLIPTFKIAPNKNLQSQQVAWNVGPYDLSADSDLEFNFAWDAEYKNWASVSINVSGSIASETKPLEVATALNSEPMFSSMFVASAKTTAEGETVLIKKKTSKNVKFYFGNDGAEKVLGFNKKAGVAELPAYFERHTIENVKTFEDSVGLLIKLDEENSVDRAVIENSGFNPDDMKQDWQLLEGRSSGLFTFQKMEIDNKDRITQVIEYPAGAKKGDLARKIQYVYSGNNSNPSSVTEIPYILDTSDLLTPS